MVELLRTKLFIPHPRENLVLRQRLIDQMKAGSDKKLTLIAAPAGFGKTTLLSEWIPTSPHCVTWLSLDEGDHDPAQFWAYFIAALQGLHPDLGSSAFALIQSPQPPPIKSILTELINDLITFSSRFASVLDDYHVIDSEPIHEGLAFLIDHLPENMRLIISTREDPTLPLAKLRAQHQLTEIRAWDLRFTQDEAGVFMRSVMGLELSRQEVSALELRTEGWAAGLQLAGLSMQSHADKKTFIADFSGSNRYVLDYLTSEVLKLQPEEIRTFLMHTAILDRLSASLCDALTGRNDSGRVLAHLEAANLFVVPLDDERRWYRYHHLFAELLRSQLTRAQPDLISELNRRASLWYERDGDIHAAVVHALQASDLAHAAHLIEQHTLQKLYKGEVAQVVGWFDRLPHHVLESAPFLCILKAWALVLVQRGARRGEVEQALLEADRALDRVSAGGTPDAARALEAEAHPALRDRIAGHAACIQAFLLRTPALISKKPGRLIALSREAQKLLPPEEKAIRSTAALNIGYGYLALGDLEAAADAFQQTLEEGVAGGNYYAAIYGPINLVIIAILMGRLRDALQLCETSIERFNRILAGQFFPPIGALYILKGAILLEYDHRAEAEQALLEGLDLVRWTGESVAPKKGYAALARLRLIQGDLPAALEMVQTLEDAWPEGAHYTQSLRHRFNMRDHPDDAEARKAARNWLVSSGIDFEDMAVIDTIDPVSVTSLESALNTAHTMATLAKRRPGAYPLEQALTFLRRQQDFAVSRGFEAWVVEIAIARTLLYQAAGDRRAALETLELALTSAASTGLLRVFVDECSDLQELLDELKPRLTSKVLSAYADHLLDAMSCAAVKAVVGEGRLQRNAAQRSAAQLSGISPHGVPPQSVPTLSVPTLSERERDVLRCLVRGLTYEEIGRQLFLSLNTVQYHVKNIYGKLMVNKRVQAIEKARQMELI